MSDGSYKSMASMAANAKKGVELRAKSERGGTEVGVHRAERPAAQVGSTEADVRAGHGYLARQAVVEEANTHGRGSDEDPWAGYLAWVFGRGATTRADRHAATLADD